MEKVKSVKPHDTRILFGYQGRDYKFMSFIANKTDNALYFRLYRKQIAPDITEESDIIRIQLPDSEPESFEGGRLSVMDDRLTQSKIIKRIRHSANGDPLAQAGANITILAVAPEHPSKMVDINGRDPLDIHFALGGDVQPFVVNFIVHRKSCSELPLANANDLMGGRFIQCKFEDMDFDLLITMSKVETDADDGKVNWPPHSVVLKRLG
ncbi:MAG: hypothetical protein WC455_06380 [Dehalococcoidia bacterium]|jgi:hypothetical protein